MTDYVLSEFEKDLSEAAPSAYLVFTQYFPDNSLAKLNSGKKNRASHFLNIGFDSIIFITMILCFFALSANMSANLMN